VYKQSSYLICSFLFEKFKFNSETSNKTLFALSKGILLSILIYENRFKYMKTCIFESLFLRAIKNTFI
jgi:hypothetical protein